MHSDGSKGATYAGLARRRFDMRGLWRGLRRLPLIPGFILFAFAFMAIFAPLISPHSPFKADLRFRRAPPIWMEGGTSKHLLGGDLQGRDILSRLIHGARVSLMVAGIAMSLGIVVGTTYGLISGYFGGLVDEIMMRIVEVFIAVPLLMVALAIVVAVGPSFGTMVAILVLFSWVPFTRQVRGEVLALKELDYVALARVAGASTPRIIVRHIFPGVINTVTVVATLNIGGLILAESVLSFLGAGIPPPTPAWGAMTAESRDYLTSSWWVSIFPGMAISLVVVAFNFFGDWLSDALNPRLRQVE